MSIRAGMIFLLCFVWEAFAANCSHLGLPLNRDLHLLLPFPQVEFLSVVQSIVALHDLQTVVVAVRDSNLLRLLDVHDLQVRHLFATLK